MKRTLFTIAAGILSTTIGGPAIAGHVQSNVAPDFATLSESLVTPIGLDVDRTIELADHCRPYRRSYHRPHYGYGGGYGYRSHYRPHSYYYPRPHYRHRHQYGYGGGGLGIYGHRGGFWISF